MIEPQVYAVQKDIKLTRRSGDAAWVVGDPCPLSTFVHFCPFSSTSVYTLQYPNSRITSVGIPSHQGQID